METLEMVFPPAFFLLQILSLFFAFSTLLHVVYELCLGLSVYKSSEFYLSREKFNLMERIFGKNLRAIRIHLGLNQANFAKPLGITGGYVLEIERGNIKKPSLKDNQSYRPRRDR